MAYADMPPEDLILLAAEYVGRGLPIPQDISRQLPRDVFDAIQHPENINDKPIDG
jgi:hypothetical protein